MNDLGGWQKAHPGCHLFILKKWNQEKIFLKSDSQVFSVPFRGSLYSSSTTEFRLQIFQYRATLQSAYIKLEEKKLLNDNLCYNNFPFFYYNYNCKEVNCNDLRNYSVMKPLSFVFGNHHITMRAWTIHTIYSSSCCLLICKMSG